MGASENKSQSSEHGMKGSFQTLLSGAWHPVLFRWRRDRLEEELRKELAFHFDQIQTELNAAGLAPQSVMET
jgi:hypothetical protein